MLPKNNKNNFPSQHERLYFKHRKKKKKKVSFQPDFKMISTTFPLLRLVRSVGRWPEPTERTNSVVVTRDVVIPRLQSRVSPSTESWRAVARYPEAAPPPDRGSTKHGECFVCVERWLCRSVMSPLKKKKDKNKHK